MDAVSRAELYRDLLWLMFAAAPVVFGSLLLLPAPYGRHNQGRSKGWGPRVPTRWAWVLMEIASTVGFAIIFFLGEHALELAPLVLMLLWQTHYFQRTFVFPFRIRVRPGDGTPLSIPLIAMITNLWVSFLNASILSWEGLGRGYTTGWLTDPRFLVGVAVFATGYYINRKADAMLAALRKPGETGYRIPRGWLYEYVSCPNYLGELTIWVGWTIATWSWGGLAFVLWTVANLLPRALLNHKWYREKFADYPPERKAVLPGLL